MLFSGHRAAKGAVSASPGDVLSSVLTPVWGLFPFRTKDPSVSKLSLEVGLYPLDIPER